MYDSQEGGEILRVGDNDRWVFKGNEGEEAQIYVICTNYEHIGNNIECPDNGLKSAELRIYDPDGASIDPDDLFQGEAGQATLIIESLPSSGEYTVEVIGTRGTGKYNIMLTDIFNLE